MCKKLYDITYKIFYGYLKMKYNLTGKKLLFLLLYAPIKNNKFNIPISGRTRLMKMGFLFNEELKSYFEKDSNFVKINLPEYFSWKYGPFSTDFLNNLEFLINQNYIKVSVNIGNAPIPEELAEYEYWIENMDEFESKEYEEEVFTLNNKGIQKAKEIWNILTKNQKNILIEFKDVLNRSPLYRILEYVYKKYSKEGYIDKSIIREKYLLY